MTAHMPVFHAWLWPDHNISKRESRQLREEQNKLLNSHAQLLAALQAVERGDASGHDFRLSPEVRKQLEAAIAAAEGGQ